MKAEGFIARQTESVMPERLKIYRLRLVKISQGQRRHAGARHWGSLLYAQIYDRCRT